MQVAMATNSCRERLFGSESWDTQRAIKRGNGKLAFSFFSFSFIFNISHRSAPLEGNCQTFRSMSSVKDLAPRAGVSTWFHLRNLLSGDRQHQSPFHTNMQGSKGTLKAASWISRKKNSVHKGWVDSIFHSAKCHEARCENQDNLHLFLLSGSCNLRTV